MKPNPLPSIEYLRECFREEDGILYWKERPVHHFPNVHGQMAINGRQVGKVAGNIQTGGHERAYITVRIDGKLFKRARIVYALHTGEDPVDFVIDHKDNDSFNDRFDNLRVSTKSQNGANASISKSNTTGFKGVHFSNRIKKYIAVIKVNRKPIYLGRFGDPSKAHAAYCEAAKKYFGEFARSG